MPVIKCGEGLSTSWKTKKEALKWANQAAQFPCVGPCPQSDQLCYRGGSLYRGYSAKTKDYRWFVYVFCVCEQAGPVEGQTAAVAWTQVRPTPKRAPGAAPDAAK